MLPRKQIRLTSRAQAGSLVGAYALLVLLTACGGDHGGGPPAPSASGTTVSGSVQAPNGQIAFNKSPGLLERMTSLFIPTVHAALSGLSTVPDGTAVQLARFNATGTSITTLATTSTKEGRYAFNVTNLGISFANDLIVQASGPTGTILRAFVTSTTVDVDPASELAVRLVVEQIAATPGASFSHFTVKEVNDIAASLTLLTTAKPFTGGANLEATITTIRNAVTADPALTAFLTAAAEAGQTTLGPGDVGNYFPFAQGNVWTVQGTRTETGQATITFQNVHTITGTKLIGPITATVFSESNNAGSGTPEDEYLTKESTGIAFRGNNDPTDTISPQFVPYQEVQFPLQVGASFHPVTKSGVDIGQDLDGDGKNETANLTSQVTVIDFETVAVPAGNFPNSAQIKIQLTSTVFPSKGGSSVTVTGTITLWHAPGIGPVKRRSVTQVPGFTETETEELVSYTVNGQGAGAVSLAITTGTSHSCALLADGTVWCWGANFVGQLGPNVPPPQTSSPTPVAVGLSKVTALAASATEVIFPPNPGFEGGYHNCALLTDGTVWCWGNSSWGQLGPKAPLSQLCGSASELQLQCSPTPVDVGLSRVVAIAAGGAHNCALLADKTVWCWGANEWGELGRETNSRLSASTPAPVTGLSHVTALATGGSHTCALLTDQTAKCWGSNEYGQLGPNAPSSPRCFHPLDRERLCSPIPVDVGLSHVTALATGGSHTCALVTDKTVKCWGRNNYGQLGRETILGLSASIPAPVTGLSNVTALATGGSHTCALVTDKTVKCWGANNSGQLGNTTPMQHFMPVPVTGLSNVTAVSAAGREYPTQSHSCALVTDGTVWCWGLNGSGELGKEGILSTIQPVKVVWRP